MRPISFITALALAVPLLLAPGDAFAEEDLGATLQELAKGQAAVLEELKAIRKLLEQGARPQVAGARLRRSAPR